MEKQVVIIKNLKVLNKIPKEDLKVGQIVAIRNSKEGVQLRILKIDPTGTGKFIGELLNYFIRGAELKRGTQILAHAKNIDYICNINY